MMGASISANAPSSSGGSTSNRMTAPRTALLATRRLTRSDTFSPASGIVRSRDKPQLETTASKADSVSLWNSPRNPPGDATIKATARECPWRRARAQELGT